MANIKRKNKCCSGCGRRAAECWTMPCLELECVLETLDPKQVNTWCKVSGAPFRVELRPGNNG